MRITLEKKKSEVRPSGPSLWEAALLLGLSIAISGCESKPVAPIEEKAGAVKSSDIVGSWVLTEMGGAKHSMVGGIMEFSSNGEMISYLPSGKKEEGKSATFWHLLHLESGEAIIATDVRFGDWSPALEQLEVPMAVVLEGDTMKWNLLEREPGHRAKPSGKTAYRFTRKSPK